MKRFYNVFRIRLYSVCLLGLVAIFIIIHITVYSTTRDIVIKQLSLNSQSTAVALSEYIMTDIDEYKEFLDTRDIHSEYYQRMQNYFQTVKQYGNIRYIYTERPIDDETVEFILDAEPIDSADYSPPGSTTFMDTSSQAVYQTGRPATLSPTVSEYGTLLGGCAPIFDTDGSLLGLTGVNLDITSIGNQLTQIQVILFIIYAFFLLMVFGLLLKYSDSLLNTLLKDKLTGAYNKRYIDKLILDEIRKSSAHHADLALLMCDLDHFKKINDTYGHAFGDSVLAATAKAITSCLRKTDYFFRFGGEEFIIILSKTDMAQVKIIAERIRAAVEENKIYNESIGNYVPMTISIGISHIQVTQNLIEAADQALYDAKKTRNTVSVFQHDV